MLNPTEFTKSVNFFCMSLVLAIVSVIIKTTMMISPPHLNILHSILRWQPIRLSQFSAENPRKLEKILENRSNIIRIIERLDK